MPAEFTPAPLPASGTHELRLTVLGTGYLGVTHAACMAELGFSVLGVDVDSAKVAALNEGSVPFHEPDLEPLLRKHVGSGALKFTTSYDEAAEFGDVHFVCVGTPQRTGDLAADLSAVDAVIDELVPKLTRACLIVGKSTVPVGTAERIAEKIDVIASAPGAVELAWSPEFLREGFAVEDSVRPSRLVAGVRSARAEQLLRQVHAEQIASGVPFLVTDFPTAELVKMAANAFLATKISFINAMADMCERVGADVTTLADALGHDHRIGRAFLNAGVGFGGGCLSKDVHGFMARASELGADQAFSLLREVDMINMRRRSRAVDLAQRCCGGSFTGRRVAVLGAAFKPNSDDIRDSPALDIAGRIQLHGAEVTVYDPEAMRNAIKLFPTLSYADSALAACERADVVLHLTEWQEFRDLDPAVPAAVVANRCIVDGRNALDADRWRQAGWTYHGLGR